MIRLFCGYDPREAHGYAVFSQSVIEHASEPVQFIPLAGKQRDGTNAFTYARFEIPERCGWAGWAIFVDACDMLALADIAELWALRDKSKALQVVKHDYKTRHPRKYLGTPMECANEDYPRKNWSSVMLINCEHWAHFQARERIRDGNGAFLHRFMWLEDDEIGSLPPEWNWLADEYGENRAAKLLHWTAGFPGLSDHYRNAPMAAGWHKTAATVREGWTNEMARAA